MKRLTIPTFLMAGALVFSACSEGDSPTELRSAPIPQFYHAQSAAGVTPVFLAGNISGDATNVCSVLQALYDPNGDPWLPGVKVDPPIAVGPVFGFTFTRPDPEHLNWTSTGNIMKAVLVKGGPNQNVYLYDPPTVFADQNLTSPDHPSPGQTPAISHYTFCYVEGTTTGGGDGCTIGYWKQNHADTWADAGYDPDDLVSSVFPAAITTANVKLIDALDLPGGPGAAGGERILIKQAVAAVLNAAHPDVDYPLTVVQIVAAVNAAIASGDRAQMIALATLLESLNSLGCPIDAHGDLIEE
jgi:hypothetical protein